MPAAPTAPLRSRGGWAVHSLSDGSDKSDGSDESDKSDGAGYGPAVPPWLSLPGSPSPARVHPQGCPLCDPQGVVDICAG